MSELQIGLLAIGVLVVVGVIAYNKWQERKLRLDADTNLKSRHDDVLLRDSAPAPDRDRGAFASAVFTPADATPAERIEPGIQARVQTAADAPRAASLNDSLDFIIAIEAGTGIEGAAMIAAAAGPLRTFSKPVLLEGYNEREARWGPLANHERYGILRAGIQLTDRRGPAGADDLASFGAALQTIAATLGVLAKVPDSGEAARQALDIDRFCREVDILVAIGVVGARGAPLAGTRIRGLAEAAGFQLDDDGRFRRRDEHGRVVFELASLDAQPFKADTMRSLSATGITLELDVPRAPGGILAFEQFRDLIRHFAQGLDGQMVDDNRKPLSPAALDQIRWQIEAVHKAMEARGLAAGSADALRLFS